VPLRLRLKTLFEFNRIVTYDIRYVKYIGRYISELNNKKIEKITNKYATAKSKITDWL
jgi:hypothetical protein